MKKRGISLVALVVTIIVLIILTGAVIATFMEGGIIDKAKEAVMKSDCTTLQEAYNIAYNTAKIDEVTGTGVEANKIEILEKVVNELGLKGFEFDITNQEVEYTGDNTEIEKWINANFKFSKLANSGYIVSIVDGDAYITGIDCTIVRNAVVKTTVKDIIDILGDEYIITNSKGIEKENESRLATGDIIINGDKIYATIVVKGETSGDSIIGVTDYSPISSIISSKKVEETDNISKAQILACDVNNDGIINGDDMKFLDTTGITTFQSVTISGMPTTQNGLLYKWHTGSTIIKELSKVYKVENDTITIPANTTYAQLEQSFREILGINEFTIIAEDKNAIIQDYDPIETDTYWKVGENEYITNDLYLEAIIQ